ncbi:ATP-binding protein, partial [Haemophilus parainfluenzae]|uniref:ATP-binding protein n=1 Tax=Haemophilus parainfluenzae TaxID=729 RepID=UPI00124B024E
LGLALVRRLVELHNGSVSVTSTPGEGSCFTVTLPYPALAAQPLPPPARSQAALAADSPGRPRLLLADSNDASATSMIGY